MKAKLILAGLLVTGLVGAIWFAAQRVPENSAATAAGRKILYYQSAMHPWIKSDKTGTVERRPLRRTLHLAGQIIRKSATASWFEFTAYERDLPWLQIDQVIEIQMPSAPGIIYSAQIKLNSTQPFADANFDMTTGSTKVRAEIQDATPEAAGLGAHKIFNGLHAEGHLLAKTPEVLTVPRSAVLSRGTGSLVYVDKGGGHYAPRAVLLGRVGDEFYEVLAGLDAGEKVVTNGNLLIDSEAQLAAGQ